MTALFNLEDLHRLTLVLTPDNNEEQLLLAMFIRFDANVLSIAVQRENGKIETLTLLANE